MLTALAALGLTGCEAHAIGTAKVATGLNARASGEASAHGRSQAAAAAVARAAPAGVEDHFRKFDTDKWDLDPGDQKTLRDHLGEICDAHAKEPTKTIAVEGHADSRGASAHNMELSHHRAEAIREWIVKNNDQCTIDPSLIVVRPYGESEPACRDKPECLGGPNDSEPPGSGKQCHECWAKNRETAFALEFVAVAATPSPTPSPAPEPAPSPPSEPPKHKHGEYLHDGFYFRLGLGPGYLAGTIKDNPEATVGAVGLGLDLALGGTPLPGLVVGGGIYGNSVSSPTLTRGDTSAQLASATASMLGAFADWYPDPTAGLHVMGAIGFGGAIYQANAGGTDIKGSGFAAMLGGGYEWWIGKQWSLGAIARVMATVPSVSPAMDSSTSWGSLEIAPAILAGITYH